MGSGGSSNQNKSLKWKKEMKKMLDDQQKQNKQKDATIRYLKHKLIDVQKQAAAMDPKSAQAKALQELEELIKSMEVSIDQKNDIIRNLQRSLLGFGIAADEVENPKAAPLDKELAVIRDQFSKRDDSVHSEEEGSSSKKAAERFAISAEAFTAGKLKKNMTGKTKEDMEFVKKCLIKNNFLRGLDDYQIMELVGCMTSKTYSAGQVIIKQDDMGDMMYLLKEGQVDIYLNKDGTNNFITTLKPGVAFGELAILYNCKRTASCRAKGAVSLWAIDRKTVQTVVNVLGKRRVEEYIELLTTVDGLNNLSLGPISRIADCLEEQRFRKGEYIIRQGTSGDIFYIIREGKVKITKNLPGGGEEHVVVLEKGRYFGERALMTEDLRSANVIAESKHVTLLILERQNFHSLIGNLDELASMDTQDVYSDEEGYEETMHTLREIEETNFKVLTPSTRDRETIARTSLKQLQMVSVLGQGGFGFVKLCKVPGLTKSSFAIKAIKKAKIVQQGQQVHVVSERNIQISLKSPFCGRLYKTFKDPSKIYFLMDSYLGGELYGVLRKVGALRDSAARFCAACCLEAIAYLHERKICYRDLKPENLMVDHRGYVILIDFGFAKKIPEGSKTWTFCGTPEYFPPEVLSNAGHDMAADYWSFGILIYELLTLTTPFYSTNDMMIYEKILGGIERVKFSPKVKKQAESIIRALCKLEPQRRLGNLKGGVNDIRKHRWFHSFDWEGLRSCRLEAPFDPDVTGPLDTKHFPKIPASIGDSETPDERKLLARANMDWDEEFE